MRLDDRTTKRFRPGFSLLEVTIGSLMVASITMMAAGVTLDMTRNMGENIARTRIATEARLTLESFRRDFAGNDPDAFEGDRHRWRLIDRMIPSSDELRLCFDDDKDSTADWTSPDRVVIYTVVDNQLLRSDIENNRTNVIAHLVDSINFEVVSGEIQITVTFSLGQSEETYLFNTADI